MIYLYVHSWVFQCFSGSKSMKKDEVKWRKFSLSSEIFFLLHLPSWTEYSESELIKKQLLQLYLNLRLVANIAEKCLVLVEFDLMLIVLWDLTTVYANTGTADSRDLFKIQENH